MTTFVCPNCGEKVTAIAVEAFHPCAVRVKRDGRKVRVSRRYVKMSARRLAA